MSLHKRLFSKLATDETKLTPQRTFEGNVSDRLSRHVNGYTPDIAPAPATPARAPTHNKGYARLCYNAKRNGLDVSSVVSLDTWLQLKGRPCVYCGSTPEPQTIGVCQIDPAISYIVTNTVTCCTRCIRVRSGLGISHEVMTRIMPKILKLMA